MNDKAMKSMELQRGELRAPCELSGDFILPDRYPDVKRILRVKATPTVENRFMSGGKLQFSGAVDYLIVFSAEETVADAPSSKSSTGYGFSADSSEMSGEARASSRQADSGFTSDGAGRSGETRMSFRQADSGFTSDGAGRSGEARTPLRQADSGAEKIGERRVSASQNGFSSDSTESVGRMSRQGSLSSGGTERTGEMSRQGGFSSDGAERISEISGTASGVGGSIGLSGASDSENSGRAASSGAGGSAVLSGTDGSQSALSMFATSERNGASVFGETVGQSGSSDFGGSSGESGSSAFGGSSTQNSTGYGGSSTQNSSGFGGSSSQNSSVYGGSTSQSGSGFGSSATQSGSGFGGSSSQNSSGYGSSTSPNSSGFGGSSSQNGSAASGRIVVETLHAVHFAAEYSGCVDLPGEDGRTLTEQLVVEPELADCSVRLLNPRKLSIRSSVSTRVEVFASVPCEPVVSGGTAGDLLRVRQLMETRQSLVSRVLTASHEQLSAKLEPDPSEPAIDGIVTCDAEFHFTETTRRDASPSELFLRGEARVDIIYKARDEEQSSPCYRSLVRKIPINLTLTCEEAEHLASNDTLRAFAEGVLTELDASVAENAYGERRVIELDLDYDVILHLCSNRGATLTLDIYSTEKEMALETEQLRVSRVTGSASTNFSVSESVPLDGQLLENKRSSESDSSERSSFDRSAAGERSSSEKALSGEILPLDPRAEVKIASAKVVRGRVQLSGTAEISCIMKCADGFRSGEFSVPVKCEIAVGETPPEPKFVCEAKAADIRARVERDRAAFDFEVTMNLILFEETTVERVRGAKLTVPREKTENPGVLLSYPSKGETLWQIAKRYATTSEAILAMNPEATAEMPRVLMIPDRGKIISEVI